MRIDIRAGAKGKYVASIFGESEVELRKKADIIATALWALYAIKHGSIQRGLNPNDVVENLVSKYPEFDDSVVLTVFDNDNTKIES